MKQLAILLAAIIILTPAVKAETFTVYPNGTAIVAVPVNQHINVFTKGNSAARVFKQVGGANVPSAYTLETNGTIHNQEVVFGPYDPGTNIKIIAGADKVYYSVGADAVAIPCVDLNSATPSQIQTAPAVYNTTSTVVAPDLMAGLITSTQATGDTITLTLPTGTLMDAALDLPINGSFEWSLINLSSAAADTVTIAAGSGHTIVGTSIVQSAHATTGLLYGNSARFRTRKTAANTFVTYRL